MSRAAFQDFAESDAPCPISIRPFPLRATDAVDLSLYAADLAASAPCRVRHLYKKFPFLEAKSLKKAGILIKNQKSHMANTKKARKYWLHGLK